MALQISDPDELALLVVQQFLRDRGFDDALAATERATGINYVEEKLATGSMLMEMVYTKIESELAASVTDLELAEREEEEALLRGNSSDWPEESSVVELRGLHQQNILGVTMWAEEGVLYTAAGDSSVRCVDTNTRSLRWTQGVGAGAVLALALHPNPRQSPLLVASSMDGTVSLLECTSGKLLHTMKAHTKYAQRVVWTTTGQLFATGSYDQTVHVFAGSSAEGEPAFKEVCNIPFSNMVEDLEPLDDNVVAVAVKGDHCLHLYDLGLSHPIEVRKVNMNAHGDSHISFVAKHLAASACKRYMLISTDVGRIIMMNTSTWKQVRNFYGVPHEQFGNPCAAFSPSGHYVFAAAAGGNMWTFHVGTAKVVSQLKVHAINLRHLEVDAGSGVLATCSYDKTVKLWFCAART